MDHLISWKCHNPKGVFIEPEKLEGLTVPRVADLNGKRIGIVWCEKKGGENYFDVLEELLKQRFPAAIIRRLIWGAGIEQKVLKETDTFIYGVGDSGIGAWESTARAITLEKLGTPGVVIFASHLVSNARASAAAQSMPGIRMATVPSAEYYPNRVSADRLHSVAEGTVDAVVDALTRPLTKEEKDPEAKPRNLLPETVNITGACFETAFEEFNQLYLDNHWGDGLPLVPPTDVAVQKMLGGTTRSPDEIIGTIASPDGLAAMGTATIEKIAINAVMAGARPEYLPVIIAAIEGLTDKKFSPHVFTSEGSFTLLIAVSGPMARKIKMNSGIGLFGHGWRANNTIGRAVRLCLINIGDLWPAEHDLALIGRPSSHTFYVMAENEESNPWPPYHTDRGYKPENTCVTVATVMGHGNMGMKVYGGGTVLPWSAEEILKEITKDIANDRRIFSQFNPREGKRAHPNSHIVVLHPEMVGELVRKGFTRQKLLEFIIQSTSVAYEDLSHEEVQGIRDRLANTSTVFFGTDIIPPDRIPVFQRSLKTGGKVPVVLTPDDIHILVSGGTTGYSFGFAYARGALQTRVIG
jgi:hypothetical protein